MKLVRVTTGIGKPTYGVLVSKDVAFAVTLEREWLDNKPSVGNVAGSCIPSGTYVCKRVNSPKFGNTFEITGVPNRSHILFHSGNIDDDSRGCVLVGEAFNPVKGKDGITSSREGFAEFLRRTETVNTFNLEVIGR